MKKLLATLLASTMALTTIGGLVACGGDDTNSGGPKKSTELTPEQFSQVTNLNDPLADKPGDSNKKVPACTITVWVPSIAQPCYETLADKFKTEYRDGKYSDVEIVFSNKDEGDVADALTTDSDAETTADIFFCPSDHITNMINNNWLLPLRGGVGSYYSAAVTQRDAAGAVDPTLKNGYAYAFPATNDNGYYLVYDKEKLNEEEADDLDKILEKAAAEDLNFFWNFTDSFYTATFFFGVGVEMDERGMESDYSAFNTPLAELGAKATIKYINNSKITNTVGDSADGSPVAQAIIEGEMIAGFNGTWQHPSAAQLATGKIGCKKLPMFTINEDNTGDKYQMASMFGGKYCGVNATTRNPAVAMALANYFTNEAAQQTRFNMYQSGPSNKVVADSDAVKTNVPLAAYSAQVIAGGVVNGNIPGSWWTGMKTYGESVFGGTITYDNLGLADLVASMTPIKE